MCGHLQSSSGAFPTDCTVWGEVGRSRPVAPYRSKQLGARPGSRVWRRVFPSVEILKPIFQYFNFSIFPILRIDTNNIILVIGTNNKYWYWCLPEFLYWTTNIFYYWYWSPIYWNTAQPYREPALPTPMLRNRHKIVVGNNATKFSKSLKIYESWFSLLRARVWG